MLFQGLNKDNREITKTLGHLERKKSIRKIYLFKSNVFSQLHIYVANLLFFYFNYWVGQYSSHATFHVTKYLPKFTNCTLNFNWFDYICTMYNLLLVIWTTYVVEYLLCFLKQNYNSNLLQLKSPCLYFFYSQVILPLMEISPTPIMSFPFTFPS